MKFATYLFWILMILWLVLGPSWKGASEAPRRIGGSLVLWVLLALLGAFLFGNPFDS